MTADDVLKVF